MIPITPLTTWQSALDYLYGLTNWETRPPGTRVTFELDRIGAVLADLGDPHHRWPAVHVGGTNGKGSTCAMVAAGLGAAGLRVGLFTSPHLHTVRERIQVDGAMIAEADVLAWLNWHRARLARHAGLTTFEALTVLAFDHFAARAVDVAVVEVGLGGRLDTTNVVRPAVTVLTPIGLDHVRVLGSTVEAIAADKAGIIKHRVPVVCAPQAGGAAAVIAAEALAAAAPVTWVGRDVTWTEGDATADSQTLVVAGPGIVDALDGEGGRAAASEIALNIPFAGRHQAVNAATAVAALAVLARSGWPIRRDAVTAGLARARWPARFERLRGGVDDPIVVVDGAHNPPAAAALRRALDDVFPGRRIHFVLGFSGDKDMPGIARALLPGAASVVAAQAAHVRAAPAATVADHVRPLGIEPSIAADPAAALALALERSRPDDVVVATGSIFLAADVRMAWLRRAGRPLPPHDPPVPPDDPPVPPDDPPVPPDDPPVLPHDPSGSADGG